MLVLIFDKGPVTSATAIVEMSPWLAALWWAAADREERVIPAAEQADQEVQQVKPLLLSQPQLPVTEVWMFLVV